MASRHTVTLESDVLAKVKAEMRRTGATFKQALNEIIRRADSPKQKRPIKPFKIKTRDLGTRPGVSFDCVWRLLDEIEPGWR